MKNDIDRYFHRKSVENYDAFIAPALIYPATPAMVELAGINPGDRVLDVACGSGIVAHFVAPLAGRRGSVAGLDAYADILEIARGKAQSEGTPIEWHLGDAAAMPFESDSFDVALCQQGLQWFADRKAVLAEIGRVLKPGGRFVANVFANIEFCPGYYQLAQAIERHVGGEAAAGRQQVFGLGDVTEVVRLFRQSGFHDISAETMDYMVYFPSLMEFLSREIANWSVRVTDEMDEVVLANFLKDLAANLQEFASDKGFSFPCRTNLVIGYWL